MSTFNGIVSEFPDIRIDFFRKHPDVQPPLACFLSHIHSDHLAGLESLRSPFVYCSAATKEILLRLERYPCRINYATGILEARQQTYKHLAKVLKPLPLETSTTIELHPGRHIQVTLFDANHCPGAVMFLIEGDGKAVLYTGDIRSEPWFVNSIARSPILVEYTSGIKTLDKIYLDTSFIQDIPFQTKAEGIAELLRKVAQYPSDTVFHFQAWTYGYEDVWVALSKALKSPIHVDDYKLLIYGSLKARRSEARFSSDYHLTPESPALTGYMCGNAPHPGCLTSDETVRLHSCEKGNMCEAARRPSTVIIQPIITHLANGENLAEVGVGGGGDDLQREAELDYLDQGGLSTLLDALWVDDVSPDAVSNLRKALTRAISTGRNLYLDREIASFGNESSVAEAVVRIAEIYAASKQLVVEDRPGPAGLPTRIQFPYSRHSSYSELCQLVEVFRPKDVWPCTVNPDEWLSEGTSIASLFGQFCSSSEFDHDIKMAVKRQGLGMSTDQADSQLAIDSIPGTPPNVASRDTNSSPDLHEGPSKAHNGQESERLVSLLPETQSSVGAEQNQEEMHPESKAEPIHILISSSQHKRSFNTFTDEGEDTAGSITGQDAPSNASESFGSTISTRHSTARQNAYYQMLANMKSDDWRPIELMSTSNEYTTMDEEL
ncbi:hypothetical protein AK830_g3245 [Neonectria ditissima]|uniref:Protein artemis n=1 Tax=Neonectria ditissima TaxID=78410 RepID=A0A0P7BIB9_9HYPO|nr:hypothetical protein AK830_g3245 [Neonectria ditissima]